MYTDTVYCTLYIAHFTIPTVHCLLYNVQRTLPTIYCTLYTAHCTMYNVQCTLYTVHCKLPTELLSFIQSKQPNFIVKEIIGCSAEPPVNWVTKSILWKQIWVGEPYWIIWPSLSTVTAHPSLGGRCMSWLNTQESRHHPVLFVTNADKLAAALQDHVGWFLQYRDQFGLFLALEECNLC